MPHLIKRSVNLQGHQTSLTMEPLFWQALEKISEKKNTSISKIIFEIDQSLPLEKPRNLSSAVRLYVFKHFYKDETT
jgi:predicted DNA-binding ribbon-helix-helix protein